jgi:hypothetical protein
VASARSGGLPLAALACGLGLVLGGCGASSGAASGKPACPAAAAVSSAAGTTYSGTGATTTETGLNCSYTASAGLLSINFARGTFSPRSLRTTAGHLAGAQGYVSQSPVRGIGDAAYMFTFRDAGSTTTELILVSGSREITVTAAGRVPRIRAVARLAATA